MRIKHVKTRVECLRNGSSAFLLQKPGEWLRIDDKNVIHSNIFVCLDKDNMAPLTFHCEALPIEKKHDILIWLPIFFFFFFQRILPLLPDTCVNHEH